jgi:hypothetical protein
MSTAPMTMMFNEKPIRLVAPRFGSVEQYRSLIFRALKGLDKAISCQSCTGRGGVGGGSRDAGWFMREHRWNV